MIRRRVVVAAAAAAVAALAVAAACSGSDDGGAPASSTTTTTLAAPATPSFAVGDLAAVEQCSLLSVAEAGALLRRPARLTAQATMGNDGTCTVEAAAPPLALVQWNVGVERLGARAYTARLEALVDELADRCGAAPAVAPLPPEGLGDGARRLTCGSTVEVVASAGGHLLFLSVSRERDPAAPGDAADADVVDAARLIVTRLPR